MRLMAILDWWEAVKDFIMENPDNPAPGVCISFISTNHKYLRLLKVDIKYQLLRKY